MSNFYPCEIAYEDKLYSSTEYAFQAAKTLDVEEREKVRREPTPAAAKKRGRTLVLRPDWEQVKFAIMEELLRLKFARGSALAVKLLATGDRPLVEGNTWGDRVWGVCGGVGENHLGRLLMKVRADLAAGS